MARILVPLLVCVLGLVIHLISARGKALGLVAFGVGLWFVVESLAKHAVSFP